MMESLSPFTRRLLAVAILFLVVVTALNLVIVPILGWMQTSLQELGDVRYQRAQLEAVLSRSEPPVTPPLPPGSAFAGRDAAAARAAFVTFVQQASAATGVRVTGLGTLDDAGTTPLLGLHVSVEGPELAVIGFLNRLEQARPIVRAREWRLEPTATTPPGVRFEGRLLAAWNRGG